MGGQRSKRKPIVTKTGIEVDDIYCRKCMRVRPASKFYDATDTILDSNGKFSVCIDCVSLIYTGFLGTSTIEQAIYKTCKILNVVYAPDAIESAFAQIETAKSNGKVINPNEFFGVYKSKIKNVLRYGVKDSTVELTFSEPVSSDVRIVQKEHEVSAEDMEYLFDFWGTRSIDDVQFLEREFAKFKTTHKADTYAEIVLLKEVCYILLKIRQARTENRPTDTHLKALQEVMKNLAISPNLANAASAGKQADSFGAWIKEIENTSPAEWIKDKSIFKDLDNIEEYAEKFITAPIRAFISGNKDFDLDNVDEGSSESGDVEEE